MPMQPPQSGDVIDGFVLGERLAIGGMGAIWSVTHPDHDLPMVMKTPFFDAGADVSTIIGYETEEMILKRLTGRHVPRFVAAGDLGKRPYLVMERVEGEDLESRLASGDPSVDEIMDTARAIAAALDGLHRQGVVHLDLKAGNVILSPRGAVLIDFGLARHQRLPDLLGEESDEPMGSSATIAPEQLIGDRSRPESDLFALGVLLYRMATGVYPYGEPQTTAGRRRRLFRPPVPPLSLRPDLPLFLQEVILHCLEVDPDARYHSAAQLLFDLNHPDQIHLTERAGRRREAGLFRRLGAWLRGRDLTQRPLPRPYGRRRDAEAPVVTAAVDLAGGLDPLAIEVRRHAARVLSLEPDARLACLTILRTRLVGEDARPDADGRSAYVSRLVALKDWAHPLGLPEDRVSFHVVEAVDPGAAILDYVRLNRVDHVVMGARAAGAFRRHLGSVSSAVVAAAPCTVTVVRLRGDDETEGDALADGAISAGRGNR